MNPGENINKNLIKPDKSFFSKRECNLCGSRNFKVLEKNEGMYFLKCQDCGLSFVDPLPSTDTLFENYNNYFETQRVKKNFEEYINFAEKSFYHQLSIVNELGGKFEGKKNFLDIGFGGGHYLLAAEKNGFTSYGVEVDKTAFERVKKIVKNVYNCEISKAPFTSNFFDIIKMAEVLEHSRDPLAFLKDVFNILKEGGFLIIDVPNQQSMMSRIKASVRYFGLRKECYGYLNPYHLYGFNSFTILKMLEKAGFEIEKVVLTSPLNRLYCPTIPQYNASLEERIIKLLYTLFGYGSTICVYARKPISMKLPISTIILTYNEEVNIENCLKSIANWTDEIFIIDSYSTDKTLEIAKRYGAKIFQRSFENQADQFNWALDNLNIKNDWILRLDADEHLTEELKKEIAEVLPKTPPEISGFYIKRRVYFMRKWIKHGGYYPTWFLRLFKKGKAKFEEREVDEHLILLEGKTEEFKNDFIDDNKKDLEWWTAKQNNFSTRETRERLKNKHDIRFKPGIFGKQVSRKRWIKEKIYSRLPLFFRAFSYFIYRYFFCFGFLDGKEGLIFHFLQGFWHQFLIDAKIYEQTKKKKIKL